MVVQGLSLRGGRRYKVPDATLNITTYVTSSDIVLADWTTVKDTSDLMRILDANFVVGVCSEYFVGGFLASGFSCCCVQCVCDRNKKMNKKMMVTKMGVGTFWTWEGRSGMNLGF